MGSHDGVNTIIRKGRDTKTHSVPCEHIDIEAVYKPESGPSQDARSAAT